MGEVWRGEHEITGRALALKFFLGVMGEKQRERMFREARATSRVNHPNVVEVLDAFCGDDGGPVIVMELLVGETLEERLERAGPLPLDEMARMMLEVIDALAAAHALGIAHRDIKPSNIFLADQAGGAPRVKLVDFGVAKVLDDGVTTTAGTVIGTPAYMAPEQIRADPRVDHRADVWSVGIVIHEALSGARPIDGTSVGALVENLVTKGVPSLAETAPSAPAALVEATERMLVRDLDRRAPDFTALANVLAGILERPAPELPAPGSARTLSAPTSSPSPRAEIALATTAATPVDHAPATGVAAPSTGPRSAAEGGDTGTLGPATRASSVATTTGVPRSWVAAGALAAVGLIAGLALEVAPEPRAAPAAPPPTATPAAEASSAATMDPAPSAAPKAEPEPPPATTSAPAPSPPAAPPAVVPRAPAPPRPAPPPPPEPAPSAAPPPSPEPAPPPKPGLVKDVPF